LLIALFQSFPVFPTFTIIYLIISFLIAIKIDIKLKLVIAMQILFSSHLKNQSVMNFIKVKEKFI